MKVFFVASIHGKEKYEKNYLKIVELVQTSGHQVSADHVLNISKQDVAGWDDAKDIDFHQKVLKGVKSSDVVISEMSYQSTSVGYLLSIAVESGIPTIAFYTGRQEPHILPTLESDDKFQAIRYDKFADLEKEVPVALSYASEQQDTRFNFFISPQIGAYLDWIAKEKKIPRAVYLRRLIEEDMEKQKNSK